jgi:thymidylate synthase ThyX
MDYKVNAESTVAQSVRDIFGLTKDILSDDDAIERVLSPVHNTYLAERLNLNAHTKLSRTLSHPHYTFRKKLSHTADSQDQRHRMTPGTRPVLAHHFIANRPDFITPPLVARNAQANALYVSVMNQTWKNMTQLLDLGVSHEFALYLLPNAFPIRFEESGDLLNLHHKWTSRLCYTAQEEIWNACLEEVLQVSEIHPRIAKHLLPPCGLRAEAQKVPICPEGKRFCGVPVWRLKREEYQRTL